uniref:Uncharacterized protein n=1 Tax=Knipowitschia caucasica TaxID=637954 RepID=A0AAV2MQN1_KNICA
MVAQTSSHGKLLQAAYQYPPSLHLFMYSFPLASLSLPAVRALCHSGSRRSPGMISVTFSLSWLLGVPCDPSSAPSDPSEPHDPPSHSCA